jgi:hypothetical protein
MATLLYRRLEEAMQSGSEVRIRLANSSFVGTPIQLDHDFVELLNLFVDNDDDSSLCERSVWMIKLTEIVAFSYPIESWSKSRLESLFPGADSETGLASEATAVSEPASESEHEPERPKPSEG